MRRRIIIVAFRPALNQYKGRATPCMVHTLLGAENGMLAIFSMLFLPTISLQRLFFVEFFTLADLLGTIGPTTKLPAITLSECTYQKKMRV